MDREVARFLAEDAPWGRGEGATVLDVGTGSGDIPRAMKDRLAKLKTRATVLALDRDPTAVVLARRSGLDVVRGDALRLPFADASIDLVTAIKFAHHFSGEPLAKLVGEMARVARRRVVVLDIQRHWLAYLGFIAWSRVFTRNRLVRYDGPLSVLRGFTAGELADLGTPLTGFDWTVRAYAGFQLALVGRRIGPGTGVVPASR
jgi:ubiquinone/menaquinone biosynthesis C-methylase UbiE